MLASATLRVPSWLRAPVEAEVRRLFFQDGESGNLFRTPEGEPALSDPASMSWQIFKNPCTLFIGGIAAVILEFAEPRVRSGVWDFSDFRKNPVQRLRRTGLAAMMTVYGPRSRTEAMIAGVRRMHGRVKGETPDGEPYSADDPDLLAWVQATAAFGFIEAYRLYARKLTADEIARYYGEGGKAAVLYGSTGAPRSEDALRAFFARMAPKLEPSPVIAEFLDIMQTAPILPPAARPFQRLMVRAGVSIVPDWARDRLLLGAEWDLSRWERRIVKAAAKIANRTALDGSPPVEACLRLGLPADFLYRRE